MIKLWRLVGDPGPRGAIDIKILYRPTRSWFDYVPIYAQPSGVPPALYPPATWLILWPAYGWVSLGAARAMWAVVDLAALATLAVLFYRALRDSSRAARVCAALAPFSMPALADALGIGQLTIVVLPLAVGAVLLAVREDPTWRRDLAAAAMFCVALVKPSLTAPLFVPMLIAPRRVRPAALTIAGYAVLTFTAARFQPVDLFTQIAGWLQQGHGHSGQGYGNVQDWFYQLGREDAFMPVSLSLLGALGLFTWYCRRSDVWLLLGISAIVARVWTYHRVYDDGVVIIAMIGTARLAGMPLIPPRVVTLARATLAVSALALWIPLQFHYESSTFGPLTITPSWVQLFNTAHIAVFMLTLVVLISGAVVELHRMPRHLETALQQG